MKIDKNFLELKRVLSPLHLYPYLKWTDQKIEDAISLYSLNLKISGSFFLALHILEVSLRNSVNECLMNVWGEVWYKREEITRDKYLNERAEEVKFRFKKNTGKNKISNIQLVSDLNFGFWTTLFSSKYNILWSKHLHKVFSQGRPIQRKDVSEMLNDLRKLRNRIAHHETIIYLDLVSLHEKCRKLIEMISPVALEWCDSLSNFYKVHPGIPIIVNDRVNPDLDLSPYRFEKSNFESKDASKQ